LPGLIEREVTRHWSQVYQSLTFHSRRIEARWQFGEARSSDVHWKFGADR
jgi:hypothetical protein